MDTSGQCLPRASAQCAVWATRREHTWTRESRSAEWECPFCDLRAVTGCAIRWRYGLS
jgi:hypothetical protein